MNPQQVQQPAAPKKNNNFKATKIALLLVGFIMVALIIQVAVRAGGVSVTAEPEQAERGSSVLACRDNTASDNGYVQLGRVDGEQDC